MKNRIARIIPVSIVFIAANTFQAYGIIEEKEETIIERIERNSNGNIKIDIPDAILIQVLQKSSDSPKSEGNHNKTTGYRIQVFSDGRNQHSLETRAKSRGHAILNRFPKYKGEIYTFSKSPNWYTRIGNFRTSSEANAALEELKQAFPGYSSEMRVVKSQITVKK